MNSKPNPRLPSIIDRPGMPLLQNPSFEQPDRRPSGPDETDETALTVPPRTPEVSFHPTDTSDRYSFRFASPNDFVDENIKMRQCCAYIINKKTGHCGCNHSEEWHHKHKIDLHTNQDIPWTPAKHTITLPTNAHGRLKLHGYGRLRAGEKPKYIRMDTLSMDTKSFEMLWTLLTEHWEVPKPQIILSINGGAKKMAPMTLRLKVALKKGLMNVSACAKTWFITPGFNLGVAKLVGEAVRDFSLANTSGSQVTAIGMATWGAVYHRHQLVNNVDDDEPFVCQENTSADLMHVADYYNSKENPGKGQAVLDPHHSHFILVDDGTERKFNSEVAYRAKFETFVAKKMLEMSATSCSPVVQVVIEGGKQTIRTAYEALLEGTPVVFIKGSGRCADLVCDLLAFQASYNSSDRLRAQIMEQLSFYKDPWNLGKKEMDSLSEMLRRMCTDLRRLVHSFNVDASEQLDRAILLAVFKSSSNMTTDGQLALAMSMGRCDLAAQEIFSDENKGKWKHMDLDVSMLEALKRGLTGFVELFLDHGISIENFLSADRIKELYLSAINTQPMSREAEELRELIDEQQAPWMHFLTRMCRLKGSGKLDENIMVFVGRLIQMFTGDSMPNPYAYPDEVDVRQLLAVPEDVETKTVTIGLTPDVTTRRSSITGLTRTENDVKPGLTHRDTAKRIKLYPTYPPRSGVGKRLYTEHDLFFWALLLNRIDLAKVFWRLGKDHIGSALVASAILEQLYARAEKDGELELAETLKTNADYFETVATGILSVAYHQDKDRAHLLLIRGLPYYGNETLLSLADQSECMAFMSHTAVQTKLTRIWMGGMSPYISGWKIYLNVLFSFLFIRFIFPLRESETGTTSANDNKITYIFRRCFWVGPSDQADILNPEYIDQNAPTARELRETVNAQQAAERLPPSRRHTYLEDFRFRQQHAWKRVHYFKAIYLFYTAPITKFLLNAIFYILFVLFFAYLVMVDLRPFSDYTKGNVTCSGIRTDHTCTPWVEIVVYIWTSSFIIEEMRQAFMRDQRSMRYKLYDWFSSGWNKFDLCLYLCLVIAIALRYTLPDNQFVYTRCLYALVMSMLMFRFMQVYYAHRNIGPQVVMISKMVNDIMFFLAIFFVFLLAYGTAAQALLYPNTPLSWDLLKKIVYFPYWQVYGDLNLDEVQGQNPGQTANVLVVIMFAVYMLFTNVLLLNLLIAMFGYTFENVQSSANQIWAYNRYDLINEFFDRPFLVPPFVILAIIYRVFVSLMQRCRSKCCHLPEEKPATDFKVILDLAENQMMSAFEQQCMERYMTEQQFVQKLDYSPEDNGETPSTDDSHPSAEQFMEQMTILREILEKKIPSAAEGMTPEAIVTPRPLGVDQNVQVGNEMIRMQSKIKGLEEKLKSQANILENIYGILKETVR